MHLYTAEQKTYFNQYIACIHIYNLHVITQSAVRFSRDNMCFNLKTTTVVTYYFYWQEQYLGFHTTYMNKIHHISVASIETLVAMVTKAIFDFIKIIYRFIYTYTYYTRLFYYTLLT